MKINELHSLFLKSAGVSTDTRKIIPNSIFFALKGENFNGNKFAGEALSKGAAYAVVDAPDAEDQTRIIKVEDTLKSLQELATFHRTYLGLPILAITGSNGKTTTKELINAVLSQRFRTVATTGNLNNHIGVPLTLLRMTSETEIGIVEMGANHQGEIAFLSETAKPDYGYITNFGKAHLEGFGGVEGVIKGKSELYDYLKENKKTIFLNIDDPIQKKQLGYDPSYTFGSEPEANVKVRLSEDTSFAQITTKEEEAIDSQLTGSYNAKNMAAAYAIGTYFNVSPALIKNAIENYRPDNNRSQILQRNSLKIILDAYNANPTSMAAALENFENIPDTPKAVFLGDMFELGQVAKEEHQQLVNKLIESEVNRFYLIGENFHQTKSEDTRIRKFRNFEEFNTRFNPSEITGSTILIKGSRGMALEQILELI